jgi:hypothetical protein
MKLTNCPKIHMILLDNLLNWAQLQTKKISADKKEINLFNITSKIVDMLRPSAELKNSAHQFCSTGI